MKSRLISLAMIVVGCIVVISSKVKLEQTQEQSHKLLLLHRDHPELNYLKTHEEDTIAHNPQSSSPTRRFAPRVVVKAGESTSTCEYSIKAEAQKDPYAAAQKAEKLPAGYRRIMALNQVVTAWVDQNSSAALAWAEKISDPDDRKAVISTALFEWSQDNPQKAIAYAETCDLGDQTIPTMGILVQKWADHDLTAAIKYVSLQPTGELKDELLSRVTIVMAEHYPDLAAQIVVERMTPGPNQIEAAISVLHQWALKDPAGAVAWANAFPAGKLKDRALNEITGILNYKSFH